MEPKAITGNPAGGEQITSTAEQLPLVLLTKPPVHIVQREIIGNEIWAGILARFEATLCEKDRTLWHNPPERVEKSPQHLRLMHAFDDFVLHQFAEWGWRLLMSVQVVHRISEWEKHHPELLERLGKEMALKARVLRGEKAAPFAEGIEQFADGAIAELTRLLHRQKEEFRSLRRRVRCEAIADWMQSEINARPAIFPLLKANLAQLHGFVHTLQKHDPTAARALQRGDMRARGFFILWYARCSNRSPRDVQNELSRRRRARR